MEYLKKNYSLESPDVPLLFDQLSFWSAGFGQLLMEHVPMQKGMTVLDVGFGSGFPLIELAQCLGNQSKLFGIDIWQEGRKRAKWKIEKTGLKNVELVEGDAASMPFEKEYFDLIVSNLGINNFAEPQRVCNECFRVLKKNGKFCLTTNLVGHFQEFYQLYESVLKELDLGAYISAMQEQIAHRGTDFSIRELLETAGFSIVKMVRNRFQMRFVDGTALLNHLLVVVGFLPGWRSILPDEKTSEVFALLENKLNEQAEWQGELKMSVPMLYVEALK
ncbi:MAG: methyltransferase domain-containing protein [Bacteroidota bacterium]